MRITPGRLLFSGLALLVGVGVALWLIPSSDYIFLPDRAKPVEPLVRVQGERERPQDDPGGIYLVDVLVRRANLLERLFPRIREGSTLVPSSALDVPGVSDKQRRRRDLREMQRSQEVGAAVALRSLGYDVEARPTGVLVETTIPGTPAVGKLRPGDVVSAVNGRGVRSLRELRDALESVRPGSSVTLTVRNGSLRRVNVDTIRDPQQPGRPFIGIGVQQAASIKLPIRVRVDTGGIGGPSAGLAFALDIADELGRRNVDRGHKVAATGQLELDGAVVPVGGVKQKTIGARQSGVDVFLVPAGENAATARRYAGKMRVFPVRSFQQALRRLATLPQRG